MNLMRSGEADKVRRRNLYEAYVASTVAPRPAQTPAPEGDISHIPERHRRILREMSQCYGVSISDMIGPKKPLKIYRARQAAMKAMRDLPNPPSYPLIGRWFNRDHTSVLHAVREPQR